MCACVNVIDCPCIHSLVCIHLYISLLHSYPPNAPVVNGGLHVPMFDGLSFPNTDGRHRDMYVMPLSLCTVVYSDSISTCRHTTLLLLGGLESGPCWYKLQIFQKLNSSILLIFLGTFFVNATVMSM